MVLQQLFCFQIPIVDAELRKAAGEEGTENEGGESSNNLHFSSLLILSSHLSSLNLSPFNFFDPSSPPQLFSTAPIHPCLFPFPSPHHLLPLPFLLHSSLFPLPRLLLLPLLQKRSVPPVPSWSQPMVPMQPRAPSRLPPCTRRKKCKCFLELNLILNNAHGDPFRPLSSPSPPLRGYFLDGKFFIAAALGSTLTKLAIRYLHQVTEPQSKNVRVNTLFSDLPTVQFEKAWKILSHDLRSVFFLIFTGLLC